MPDTRSSMEILKPVLEGGPLAAPVAVGKAEIEALAAAAYAYFQQGMWDQARNVFSALVTLAPKLYVGHAGLGAVALAQQDLREAFRHLDAAAQMRPADPAVFSNAGEVVLRMGHPDKAEKVLRAAVALDPKGKDPSANRARAMLLGIESARTAAAQA